MRLNNRGGSGVVGPASNISMVISEFDTLGEGGGHQGESVTVSGHGEMRAGVAAAESPGTLPPTPLVATKREEAGGVGGADRLTDEDLEALENELGLTSPP